MRVSLLGNAFTLVFTRALCWTLRQGLRWMGWHWSRFGVKVFTWDLGIEWWHTEQYVVVPEDWDESSIQLDDRETEWSVSIAFQGIGECSCLTSDMIYFDSYHHPLSFSWHKEYFIDDHLIINLFLLQSIVSIYKCNNRLINPLLWCSKCSNWANTSPHKHSQHQQLHGVLCQFVAIGSFSSWFLYYVAGARSIARGWAENPDKIKVPRHCIRASSSHLGSIIKYHLIFLLIPQGDRSPSVSSSSKSKSGWAVGWTVNNALMNPSEDK